MSFGPGDILWVDKPACRTLADGLGTAGQEIQILCKGGATVDSLTNGLTGAQTPEVAHAASQTVNKAMDAVGTALMEMGGVVVGAISTFSDQDAATAQRIAAAGQGAK